MTNKKDDNDAKEELISSTETVDGKLHDKALEGFEQDLVESDEESQQGEAAESKPAPQTKQADVEEESDVSDTEKYQELHGKLDELSTELEEAKNKAEENWSHFVRAKADIENLERRSKRDLEHAHKYAGEKLLEAMLPIIDSLEMGANAAKQEGADIHKVLEGMELTLKLFEDTLAKFEVKKIDPLGEAFNPEYHQAMSIQETDEQKPNTVMMVMQKGYLLNERLIRPAMVIVSKAPAKSKGDVKDTGAEPPAGTDAEKVGTNIDEKA